MADGFAYGGPLQGGDIACNLKKLLGQTVTIYATCGGCSGSGFTGVLIYVDDCVVKLITRIGTPPSCSLGSTCCPPGPAPYRGYGAEPFVGLGSITTIPIASIASFVQNAIGN
ncbi:hypothetical protein EDC19_0232 [Natranaerovirga hydrolytica]|uniref:Uncharacterized protein n=1 Tax=Natranaerovirga hydrolytica TaxID=680378 RepID=A0A4R1MZ00_9FIRM|nr:hypothetical protein [Natranaerovirga hydrolytica]TCK97830.1 hypothetical protein EDC19_0232 [Natranaerovirga hydrolytica]